ncbi:AAA family ATPase [Negativibacillus massiliensis]|uniref:AAA family ATPase n=1 Tax=Negativibacillus massiliensis TaxID=1871035 RepID=UPI003AF25DEA
MLIRFAVENYKSFKDRQIFSMVAGKQTRHPEHCILINGKRLLKSSFFFGANASGKSNFVNAIDFMRRVVLVGTKATRYSDRFFRIDPKYKEKLGIFQMDFLANHNIYSYGFALNYLKHEYQAEWLYRIDSAEREVCIFERQVGEKIQTELSLPNMSKMRFQIYTEDIKENELLLKVIGDKDLDKDSGFSDFCAAYNWFKKIEVVYPESHVKNQKDFLLNSFSNSDSLMNMLRFFDTGILDVRKGKQPAEKAFSFLPDELRKSILDDIVQNANDVLHNESNVRIEIGQFQFDISIENGEIMAEKILFDHGNKSDLFELVDESDGTIRLFDLLPVYDLGQKEKIIIIDELDRSLHSKLTQKYIELFYKLTKGRNSQLICTTHDLNLMDLKLLRQDEIWFVEREKDQASRLYSLSNYKQRFDKNILNDYLLGRYGAIPCFNDIEFQEDGE